MDKIDQITESILKKIDGTGFKQEGAYNLRYNGYSLCHGSTEHIKIKKKEDKQGIDVYISSDTKGEQVHIPVVVAASGVTDEVYNDFYIGEGADVTIVAGCGIHNSGGDDSRHDGIHTFHIGKGANVRYEEKHYGEGEGVGARILNPVTKIFMEAHSLFTLDTVQIKGVDLLPKEVPSKFSTQKQLVMRPVMLIFSAILLLWIRQGYALFQRSMLIMWMLRSFMKRQLDGSIVNSLSN